MENIGNIEIEKYCIGFWNCEIDIDKYRIKILSLIPDKNKHIEKITILYFAIQNSASVISR